jgi:hypothetical protein
MKLLEDHAVLLLIALLAIIVAYVVIVLAGKPVDERIIGVGFVVTIGALAGLAKSK